MPAQQEANLKVRKKERKKNKKNCAPSPHFSLFLNPENQFKILLTISSITINKQFLSTPLLHHLSPCSHQQSAEMRTRFLTTDYFAPDQTLDFLRFPLSPLPPPPKPLSISDLLRCCAGSADNSVSYELPSLPIGDALSKFYSDVLPHTIDVCYDDFSSNSGSSYGDVQIPKVNFAFLTILYYISSILRVFEMLLMNSRVSVFYFEFCLYIELFLELRTAD